MAKKRKQKGSGKRRVNVSSDRLDGLLARIDSLSMEELSDDEFEAVAEHFSKPNGGDPLAGLSQLKQLVGSRKARAKALKRVAFKLGQRGIDVSSLELDDRQAGIQIAAESTPGGGLPVLMAPININAERRFTFALRRGPAVLAVEGVFKTRELYRLVAQPSGLNQFRQWANAMCRPGDDGSPPERVTVPAEWLERKFWEMGHYKRTNELGREIDRELLDMVTKIHAEPSHPIHTLELDKGQQLSVAELAERPERLHPFYHGSAMAALRQQWYEFGGSEDLVTGADVARELRSAMEKAVADWAKQWGLDRVAEVLLDTGLYCGLTGDLDAARTFHEVVYADNSAQRDDRIRAFLYDFALWQLKR